MSNFTWLALTPIWSVMLLSLVYQSLPVKFVEQFYLMLIYFLIFILFVLFNYYFILDILVWEFDKWAFWLRLAANSLDVYVYRKIIVLLCVQVWGLFCLLLARKDWCVKFHLFKLFCTYLLNFVCTIISLSLWIWISFLNLSIVSILL